MKILPLSFLGRLRGGGGFGFCSLVDEDASSACSLFSNEGFGAGSFGSAAVWTEVESARVEEWLCDCGLARTDSAKV